MGIGGAIKHLTFLVVVLAIAAAAGCGIKTGTVRNEQFLQRNRQVTWNTVAVLPFTGAPQYRRSSSELFSIQLLQQRRFTIIPPAVAEIELKKHNIPYARGIFSTREAQEAGRLLAADAVIIGAVSLDYSFQLEHGEGVVEARLIDTASGEVVVSITQAGPFTFGYINQHPNMMAATENTASDMLNVLRVLSGEPLPEPAGMEHDIGPSSSQ
jgi:hypothetical protein